MSQYPPGYQPARRPVSKQVYRRRRTVAVAVLVVIVVLIIVGISQCSSGGATPAPTTPPTQPVPAPTISQIPGVVSTPAPTTTPGAPIAGVDVGYVGKEPVCATKALKVTAATDKTAYGANEQPKLSMGIQNIGTTACKVNVGTNAQVFQVSSNGSLKWQSTDCQSGALEYWALLQPQQQMNSATPLSWSREVSTPETCDSPTRTLVPAGGATYYLTTFMGAAKSPQSKAFTLN